ncbi:LamG-like jellyroll fold domain-containing protein [Streptomyces sp. NPDC059708]|uniref:LamG-like jellyroll fold domain-containing protein n=1 Tax=Streptomyces sp. NPDC059708 TaxID=3346916 RepID=UPI003699A925
MTDGTDRPDNPQPGPASGGYGYPQPGQSNPYQPEPATGQPGQGFGPPPTAAESFPPPIPETFTPGPTPDWQAMADASESQRRKRRLLTIGGGVLAVLLVAGGAAFFVLQGGEGEPDDKPTAASSGSPTPSGGAKSPSRNPDDDYPTLPGEPNVLRDYNGKTGIALGPGASLGELSMRTEVRFKGAPDSYAQGAEAAVDVTKSFSVSTRAYNTTEGGSHMAVSQGDGDSYSFELGFEVVNGKKAWVFRVQTGDKGQAATAQQVVVDNVDTVKKWALLTGTYDAEKKTIALWVDDKQAGQAQVSGIWAGPGPVQLGRARHHGIWSASWEGALDHIRIFDQAINQEQVTALKNNKPGKLKPVHSWLV